MKATVKYLSSGVNQTQKCFDWADNVVAYSADSGILLYNPKTSDVVGASPKVHKSKITSVRWVKPAHSSGQILISTGEDCKTVVWILGKDDTEGLLLLKCLTILDHEEGVSLADAMMVMDEGVEKLLVVTATTDMLHSWLVCLTTGEEKYMYNFRTPGRAFVVSLMLMRINEAKYPLLLLGGHDCRIHIFTSDDFLGYYEPKAVLNGHEDWVTTLDVMQEDNGKLLLASGSKDSSVRIWQIKTGEQAEEKEEAEKKVLKLRSVTFMIPSSDNQSLNISILLDALLAGHEGLVSEVYWARSVVIDGAQHQPYRLLSCSKTLDRSIIIWEPEEGVETGGGIWLEAARLGEVGGNMEGYFACQFSPDGTQVLGCSFQGALHMWENQTGTWNPYVVVGGHFREVSDITWDPLGRYLLSSSKDQTSRLHAPWKVSEDKVVWHEVGRPQVHGYDLACICSLGSFQFASGAEEKVIRGFAAPANTIRNFGQICDAMVEEDINRCRVGEGASVPSLGLSNKSVMMSDLNGEQATQDNSREEVQAYFKPVSLKVPPTEDQLMQNTLWPEAAKLYGHGHDLIALASTPDGSLFASSCRAAQEADANIILWDAKTWQQVDSLCKHRLTVTQMEFSPNGEYLLSVSRDRSWTIFKRTQLENDDGITYAVSDFSKSKDTMHARVIWACGWMPDSRHFVTASRDKTVAVWGLNEETWTKEAVMNETDEVTAVAVTVYKDSEDKSHCLIATGLVNGEMNVRQYKDGKFSEEILKISHKHQKGVKRLQFRPCIGKEKDTPLLASCGEDNRVYIYEVSLS